MTPEEINVVDLNSKAMEQRKTFSLLIAQIQLNLFTFQLDLGKRIAQFICPLCSETKKVKNFELHQARHRAYFCRDLYILRV